MINIVFLDCTSWLGFSIKFVLESVVSHNQADEPDEKNYVGFR